jgi:uncharacterized membrane protein
MLKDIAILFGITMIPALELRASIPVGLLATDLDLPFGVHIHGMAFSWQAVFAVCVVSNFILGVLLYPVLGRLLLLLERIPLVNRFWRYTVERTQRRIHPYVERWGMIGVALFIAIPLPGSGTYSGALGAFLMGMSYRRFLVANAIGVLVAGAAVTAVVLSGTGLFHWAVSV